MPCVGGTNYAKYPRDRPQQPSDRHYGCNQQGELQVQRFRGMRAGKAGSISLSYEIDNQWADEARHDAKRVSRRALTPFFGQERRASHQVSLAFMGPYAHGLSKSLLKFRLRQTAVGESSPEALKYRLALAVRHKTVRRRIRPICTHHSIMPQALPPCCLLPKNLRHL